MSWQCTQFEVEYLERMRCVSGQSCNALSRATWQENLTALPRTVSGLVFSLLHTGICRLECTLEQLRGPMKNADAMLFKASGDLFYLNLLNYNVIMGADLHARILQALSQAEGVYVWMVLDVLTFECCALMEFRTMPESAEVRSTYRLGCLCVRDHDLRLPRLLHNTRLGMRFQPVHEVLLQAWCLFADMRSADLHILEDALDKLPLCLQYVLALHGFLSVSAHHVMRPPWNEVVRSMEMLSSVERQIKGAVDTLRAVLVQACKTTDFQRSMAASTEPSAPSKSGSMPTGSAPPPAPTPATDTPLQSTDTAGTTPTAPRGS